MNIWYLLLSIYWNHAISASQGTDEPAIERILRSKRKGPK